MKTLWMFLSLMTCSLTLFATPAQVILIRHAEKPDKGVSLSKQGFERAAAFVPFFTLPPANSAFQLPVAIYAMVTSKNHSSTRCVQTVGPLASALGIPLIAQYTWGDYKAMVDAINQDSDYEGKTVMICWEHKGLGDIAAYFGVKPTPVYGSVYDRLWVIDFDDGNFSSFQDLPQQLMYGDTTT